MELMKMTNGVVLVELENNGVNIQLRRAPPGVFEIWANDKMLGEYREEELAINAFDNLKEVFFGV